MAKLTYPLSHVTQFRDGWDTRSADGDMHKPYPARGMTPVGAMGFAPLHPATRITVNPELALPMVNR